VIAIGNDGVGLERQASPQQAHARRYRKPAAELVMTAGTRKNKQAQLLRLIVDGRKGRQRPLVAQRMPGCVDQRQGKSPARFQIGRIELPEISVAIGPLPGNRPPLDMQHGACLERLVEGGLQQNAIVADGRKQMRDEPGTPVGFCRVRRCEGWCSHRRKRANCGGTSQKVASSDHAGCLCS
jgi:hypothetical protein